MLALAIAILPGGTSAHASAGPVHVLSIKQLLASCGGYSCTDCPGYTGGLRLYSRVNQQGDCIRFTGAPVTIPLADVSYSDGQTVYYSFASWSTTGSSASGQFQKNVSGVVTISFGSGTQGNLPSDYVNNTIAAIVRT